MAPGVVVSRSSSGFAEHRSHERQLERAAKWKAFACPIGHAPSAPGIHRSDP
jgi:hypothetical protein